MPTPQPDATRRFINLPGRPDGLPFSDAVLAGNTLYISGRIGIDDSGRVPASIADELKILFTEFEAVVTAAGMTLADLVQLQIFCPDVSLGQEFNRDYVKHFHAPFPARAFLGSGPLLLGGRFEMMGIAVKSS